VFCYRAPHLALLLELSLLYRLGKETRPVRRTTRQGYIAWATHLLDATIKNSVASAAQIAQAQLQTSETLIANGALAAAVAQPGSRQAVYGVEHQFGSTVLEPWAGNDSYADLYGSTWISLYAVVTLNLIDDSRESIWVFNDHEPKIEAPDVYYRKAYSDIWYGRKMPYTIKPQTYDSGDVQRFEGENTAQRVADVGNHPLWRNFIVKALPADLQQIRENNDARVFRRYSNDSVLAVTAARSIALGVLNGKIHSSIETNDDLTLVDRPKAS
jgi:hypothetical protein